MQILRKYNAEKKKQCKFIIFQNLLKIISGHETLPVNFLCISQSILIRKILIESNFFMYIIKKY